MSLRGDLLIRLKAAQAVDVSGVKGLGFRVWGLGSGLEGPSHTPAFLTLSSCNETAGAQLFAANQTADDFVRKTDGRDLGQLIAGLTFSEWVTRV